MASNKAGLNEITGDDTGELTTSAPLNSLSVPVSDMVGHSLTRTCSDWKWSSPALKFLIHHSYKPSKGDCCLVKLKSCMERCQGCQIMIQTYHHLKNVELRSEGFLRVIWRPIETGVFLSVQHIFPPNTTAMLSAVEGIPNPWSLQSPLLSAESTGSSACVRLVRRWLDDCINNHPSCESPDDSVLPTRVLDLGLDASSRVSLWEPRGRTGRYACLSYCWGKSKFTVRTRENFRKHLERGIELKNLPQTFQDAVEFARGLKVRYLWIDALCIIQNEDDHEDWKRECGNMAGIYRNSCVTIAAAWAASANNGCFTTPPGVAIGPVMMRKVSHFPFMADQERSTDFPILTRAWTFQERLLAPRVIYFGRQEIMWDCVTKRRCECGGERKGPKENAEINIHNQRDIVCVGRLWRQVVKQYSPLQLTCPDDKLPALSGLAQAMRFKSQEGYLAGLWKETLLFDMCWTVVSPKTKEPHQARWRAPSWSWASIDGPIKYHSELLEPAYRYPWKEHALVLEAKCTPAGPSLTGQVKDGFVTLDAVLLPVRLKAGELYADCIDLEAFWLDWFPDWAYETEEMAVIYLVPLSTTYHILSALVVKPCGQGKEMTRVGLARCDQPGLRKSDPIYFTFLDCERQIVKIV